MKNIELKRKLLENGTFSGYCRDRKHASWNNDLDSFEIQQVGINENGEVDPDAYMEFRECENMRNNKRRQSNKIREHIEWLVDQSDYDIYFVTFNFNSYALTLTAYTRKQKVRRLLSKANDYILNIDYGKTNEREHYHGIIALKKGTYEIKTDGKHIRLPMFEGYDYGFVDVLAYRDEEKSSDKVSKYIAKLTNHALKIKQQYVSVKKGSEYQRHKKALEKVKRQRGYDPRYDRV